MEDVPKIFDTFETAGHAQITQIGRLFPPGLEPPLTSDKRPSEHIHLKVGVSAIVSRHSRRKEWKA